LRQEVNQRFSGCAADLTVIAVLAAGNDYLPALRGTSLNDSATTPSLWSLYLRLRDEPEWATQCASPRSRKPAPPAPLRERGGLHAALVWVVCRGAAVLPLDQAAPSQASHARCLQRVC
jgi:hypothetical protein